MEYRGDVCIGCPAFKRYNDGLKQCIIYRKKHKEKLNKYNREYAKLHRKKMNVLRDRWLENKKLDEEEKTQEQKIFDVKTTKWICL